MNNNYIINQNQKINNIDHFYPNSSSLRAILGTGNLFFSGPLAYIFILYYGLSMHHKTMEKKLKLFLFMYLILSLIRLSAISASEAFWFESPNNDSLGSSGCFSAISYNIDWLTGEIITLKKANGYSDSLLRNRLLRIFTFAGLISIAVYLVGAKQKTVKNGYIPITKSLVILNLRI
jgi:hypothetical protein